MQRYKSPQELPFNITPAAKEGWNNFIKETLNGNPKRAIAAYHAYSVAKENAFSKQSGGQEMDL